MKANLSSEQLMAVNAVQHYLTALGNYLTDSRTHYVQQQNNEILPHRATEIGPPPTIPKPPHIFVTGPGGTGKSHLIHTITLMVQEWVSNRITEQSCPTKGVLLMAPTGVAAFNIDGTTIHHGL